MPLTTHIGAASPWRPSGPEMTAINQMENNNFFGRRSIWWMIFGGVFERHPGLKLVITETPGLWWMDLADKLDDIYHNDYYKYSQSSFFEQVPRLPSEYMLSNVFVGASFMSHFEAEDAVRNGYYTQYMWGSDYPHAEGTFQFPDSWEEPPSTQLSLRYTFHDMPEYAVRAILGENAMRIYGLNAAELTSVANRINAPRMSDIAEPLEQIPEKAGMHAFRVNGAWS